MRREGIWWIVALLGAVTLAIVGGLWPEALGTATLALVLFLGIVALGKWLADERDRDWLTVIISLGFLVRLVGSWLRYLMVVSLYESGDSLRYHAAGLKLVHVWRAIEIPRTTSPGSVGTHFVELVTGLLYVPYVPTLFGGFLIFGTLAFLGQLGLYAAFRRALPPRGLKAYAILLFFLPSLVFWPSSIGKEALMLLAIGLFAVGAAGLLTQYQFRWGFPVALGSVGAAVIRPHVGLLMVGSLGVAALLARRPPPGARVRRIAVIIAAGFIVTSLITFAGERYDIAPNREGLERFAEEVSENTSQGGSEVEGSMVSSAADVPVAALRVLFRPLLPGDVHNFQALLSALEGVGLLFLVAWRWPHIWRNLRSVRKYPYLMLSAVFVLGFAIVFSPILNLGILVRQRTQATVFFLVLMVGLGWRKEEEIDLDDANQAAGPHEVVGASSG